MPQELRALFDLAWIDLTEDELDPQEDDSNGPEYDAGLFPVTDAQK